MGDPKQEFWLAENLAATGCRLGIGVGALLDFVAGQMPRAPGPIRRAHLEWAYRLAIEPRRLWRRYVVECSTFLVRVAVQWWSGVRVPDSESHQEGRYGSR
jgi:UDP-N-acetyl-D-mannosaminuronic acid transferase (WecB/TagA/CpsF family)